MKLTELLDYCIAEATAELGPKLLNASEIYADLSRRLLEVVLDGDASAFDPSDQIITVRVKDVETWILEAFKDGKDGWSGAWIEWRSTPTGFMPTMHLKEESP